jgi:putative hydrolase of the HAD superfamily
MVNRVVAIMIKAIIFDLGGVIVDIEPLISQVFEVFQPEDEEKFWEEINTESIPLCKGEISLLQFWKRIASKAGKDIPEYVLKDLWVKDYEALGTINQGVQDIVYSLKKSYKLAILSNSIKENAKFGEKLGIYEIFDVVILSHEVGLTKEEGEIFLLVAERLGATPEECIFIDDVHAFVTGAKSVGMQAILFQNARQLKSDLEALDITI